MFIFLSNFRKVSRIDFTGDLFPCLSQVHILIEFCGTNLIKKTSTPQAFDGVNQVLQTPISSLQKIITILVGYDAIHK